MLSVKILNIYKKCIKNTEDVSVKLVNLYYFLIKNKNSFLYSSIYLKAHFW